MLLGMPCWWMTTGRNEGAGACARSSSGLFGLFRFLAGDEAGLGGEGLGTNSIT